MSRHRTPVAKVSGRAARRLRGGGPWVYRQDVSSEPEAESGEVVRVTDERGTFIGQAFWATASPIALRMLTRSEEPVDAAFFRRRLEAALARRQRLFPTDDAYRVVHGEADLLPGLFVDRYGDALTIQTISEGMAAREAEVVQALDELLSPRLIALRNDTASRDFEGLPRTSSLAKGEGPAIATFHEGENLFEIDLIADAKTGSFLDQRENHLRATEYARGRGLDCFTYHGGFALALARGCDSVLAVDQADAAVAKAQANVERNGLTNVEVRAQNAFDLLRRLDADGERFDVVVLDPPGLAKRREGIAAAERAYKELNLRALRILQPDGVLITCSCSGKISPEHFGEILQSAIVDSRRSVQILERRGAGRDHPGFAGLAESEYLKCWVLRVL